MYTTFGLIDKSLSMFLGNIITFFMYVVQLSQKIYYDRQYRNSYDLIKFNTFLVYNSVFPKLF